MTEMSREIAVLFWVVAAALVAIVVAIVALVRSGRTVPPFAETATKHTRGPGKKPAKGAGKRNGPFIHAPAGRT